MTIIFLLAFLGSVFADESLFRAIESENPELFNNLGKPGWFATMWNPVVIFKVLLLLTLPTTFEVGSYLHKKLWVSRIANIVFISSLFLLMAK